MKMCILLLSFMITSCVLILPGAGFAESVAKAESEILVDDLLNQVQRALINVQNEANELKLPELQSVKLQLSTQFLGEVKGKINLYIVSFGAGISEESVQTLSLTLTPPKPLTKLSVAANDFSKGLASAIISASRAVKNAGNREPKLLLKELSAKIKFIVKKEGNGGVNFLILPVSVELGGGVKSAETHEITVTFKNDEK